MSMEEKTVEYCFDSNIYTGEDIKTKIEEIKRTFSKISNKPIIVRVELNELGLYVLSFKIYARRKVAKMKQKKLNKVYIESLGEYSNGYINNLIENKDDRYIKKLNNRSKEQKEIKSRNKEKKELDKRLKEVEKQQNKQNKQKVKKQKQAKVEYIKENPKKVEKTKQKENIKKYNNYKSKEEKKKIDEEKIQRTPHIEYLYREEESKNFKEMLNDFLQMLRNINSPKLERKNKINEKNVKKVEKEYHYHYNQNNKKKNQIGEKHYWSDNYIPKQYGKYKETNKTFKPL